MFDHIRFLSCLPGEETGSDEAPFGTDERLSVLFSKDMSPKEPAGIVRSEAVPLTGRLALAVFDANAAGLHTLTLQDKATGRMIVSEQLTEAEWKKLPENIRTARFSMGQQIDAFYRPPVTSFVRQNLFYMESFSVFHCDRDFFTSRRDYASYLIIFTYEGAGKLTYEGKTCHLAPGDGFFIDCRRPHDYRTEGDTWVHSVLHFNGRLMPYLYSEFLRAGDVSFRQPVTGSYQTKLESLLMTYQSASGVRDYEASSILDAIVTELLAASADQSRAEDDRTQTVHLLIHYMEQHYTERLTLDFLARFAGVSKYHLSRIFREITGESPVDYLIGLRIERAKELLESTDLPANKIGAMVGIHDANNFTNLFKKHTGETPGAYRRTKI